MTRLTTVSISRDSADQRAGRAGRVEPGVAYRLWSKVEHGTRPAHRAAEITQVDLAGLALELAAWGTPAEQLSFIDQPPAEGPPAGRRAAARRSARSTPTARSPPLGRRWSGCPVHPRLARMIVGRPDAAVVRRRRRRRRARRAARPRDRAAGRPGHPRRASSAGSAATTAADRRAVARVRERAADIARRAGIRFDAGSTSTPIDAGAALLVGFPDRLAGRRRPGQFQLRNGSGAWVADDDPLATVPFVVAADLDGKRSGARIRLGAAVDRGGDRHAARRGRRGPPAGVGRRRRRPRRADRAPPRRAPPG